MTTLDDLRRARQAQMDAKQDVLQSWPALLGRVSDQLVPVAGRDGYVHVRIGSDETAGQARNKKVPDTYDLAVYVGYDGISPEFQVLSIRQEDWVGAGYAPIPEVGPHGATHTWPTEGDAAADGSDVTYVAWRQILSLRIGVTAAFTVEVGRGPLYRVGTGQWEWIATQNINLAADQPVAGARWALVYLDDSGVLQRRLGAIIVPSNALVFSDCPAPLSEEFPLAAVRLYATQTAITETRIVQDVIDLRFQASGGGGTTLPAYARGSIIYGDAADWAALVHPGAVYHLQTNATDVVWLRDIILDDGVGDSPEVQFIGGSNDDTALIYLDDDAVAGDSDLVIQLPGADADSRLLVRSSAPATVAYIDAAGNADFLGHLAVGATASVITTSVVQVAETTTAAAGNLNIGVRITYTAAPIANTGGRYHGVRAQVVSTTANNFTSTVALRGFFGGIALDGTGIVTGAIGVQASNNVTVVGARCTTMVGFDSTNVAGAGDSVTITNLVGLRINDVSGGTWNVTNQYGILINSLTTGATSYAIYTNLGNVRFGDAVLIDGSGAADVQLTVQGAVAQAANLQEWESSAAAVLLSVTAAGNLRLTGEVDLLKSGDGVSIRNVVNNQRTNLRVMPQGVVGDVNGESNLEFFMTDYVGDAVNWERLHVKANANVGIYEIFTEKGGTGTVRPMALYTAGNTSQLYLTTGGHVVVGMTDSDWPFRVAIPFAKTDTTARNAVWIGSNEAVAANPAGLLIQVDGAAAQADRNVILQTQEKGVANAGNLLLQLYGGRVVIGTVTPAPSAILELGSTTGALLLPRMTTAQRNALAAVDGMVIYNTTTGVTEGREGGAWVNL